MIDLRWNFPLIPGQDALWRERLRTALLASANDGLDGLRPSFRGGDTRLREIAAAWLGESPERVWLSCGGHHGCMVALLAGGLAGRRVAVEAVTYTGFLEQCRFLGVNAVACAMDGEGMRADALRELCARERAAGQPLSAVFTMPTLHNPVGCVASESRRQEIVAVAREFDLLVIEDDAYGFLYPNPQPGIEPIHNYAQLAPERTFYVRGLSKSFAPAVRTGLLVAPVEYAAATAAALKSSATGVSRWLAGTACSMLEDGTMDGVSALKRTEGAARQAHARELLAGLDVSAGANAWHLWVSLPEGLDPDAVQATCEDRGVLVSSGQGFRAPGAPVPGAVRLALGGEIDPERAAEGVRIFAQIVRDKGGS
jgi:DNA-binding transcriptional MocR family regulator